MSEPVNSNFPQKFDTTRELMHVVPDFKTKLRGPLNISRFDMNGENTIDVESTVGAPVNGYITITHPVFGNEGVTTRMHYTGKTIDSFVGVTIASDSMLYDFPVSSRVVMNCMAQHHNMLVRAARTTSGYIGDKAAPLLQVPSDDEKLISEVDRLYRAVHVPVPWFIARPENCFVGEEVVFEDRTSRIISGDNLSYYWEFGDDTFLHERLSNGTWVRQDISGDGSTSAEVRTATRIPIIKRYDSPGIYTVKLIVSSDVGEREVAIDAAVTVLGRPPSGITVSTDKTRAFVGDPIRVDASLRIRDAFNPVTEWGWTFYDDYSKTYPNSPNISFVPTKGGIVPAVLHVRTENGNFTRQHSPRFLDITESPSLWNLSRDPGGSQIFPREFSPISKTWKDFAPDANYFIVDNVLNAGVINGTSDFNANHSGGFHGKPRSRAIDSYVFRADTPRPGETSEVVVKKWQAFTYTWSSGGSAPLSWNWTSIDCPMGAPNRVFFFGQPGEQNTSVVDDNARIFDMRSETFHEIGNYGFSSAADVVSREKRMRRKYASIGSRAFIASGAEGGSFSSFSSFQPSSMTMSSMSAIPEIPTSGDIAAANFKIWAINSSEQRMYCYDAIANTWSSGVRIPDSVMQGAHGTDRLDRDSPRLEVSMTSEHNGTFDSRVFIDWHYSQRAGIIFNALSGALETMPERPGPQQTYNSGAW